MTGVDNNNETNRWSSRPKPRLARFSFFAMFVSILGVVFLGIWVVAMALQGGGALSPSIIALLILATAFILVASHWREIVLAETERRRAVHSRKALLVEGGIELSDDTKRWLALQDPAASRLNRARGGFWWTLSRAHKAHTIASLVLALILAGFLIYVSLRLVQLWLIQR